MIRVKEEVGLGMINIIDPMEEREEQRKRDEEERVKCGLPAKRPQIGAGGKEAAAKGGHVPLTQEEALAISQHKAAGNKFFAQGNYEKAQEMYALALQVVMDSPAQAMCEVPGASYQVRAPAHDSCLDRTCVL